MSKALSEGGPRLASRGDVHRNFRSSRNDPPSRLLQAHLHPTESVFSRIHRMTFRAQVCLALLWVVKLPSSRVSCPPVPFVLCPISDPRRPLFRSPHLTLVFLPDNSQSRSRRGALHRLQTAGSFCIVIEMLALISFGALSGALA